MCVHVHAVTGVCKAKDNEKRTEPAHKPKATTTEVRIFKARSLTFASFAAAPPGGEAWSALSSETAAQRHTAVLGVN